MRKIMGAFCAAALAVGLVACGGAASTSQQSVQAQQSQQGMQSQHGIAAADDPTEGHDQTVNDPETVLASKKLATEARITGASIHKPDGWYIDDIKGVSATLAAEGSDATVAVAFEATADAAFDYAMSRAIEQGVDAGSVQVSSVGDVEWAYFCPGDTEFQAFAPTSDGVMTAHGTHLSWEDGAPVIGAIVLM